VTKPANQADHLWRRALFIQQADEVPILGHHHSSCLPYGTKDRRVAGVAQSDITDGKRLDAPLLRVDPAR